MPEDLNLPVEDLEPQPLEDADLLRPVTRTINGEDVTRTVGDWLKVASKVEAADKYLQDASATRKDYETDLAISRDLRQALKDQDPDAMRRAMLGLGLDEDAVQEQFRLFKELQSRVQGTPTTGSRQAQTPQAPDPFAGMDPQSLRDARNLATSSRKSLWLLKKNDSLEAKESTSRPAATAAST